MTVGGWYDNEDLYGALKTYQHIEKQNPGIFNVLVVGPWDHGGWARSDGDWLGTAYFGQKTGEYYRENIELPFFNHFLKDKGDISQIKEVNLFDTGAHEWRAFETYNPTNGTRHRALSDGKRRSSFSTDRAESGAGFDEYVSDPMESGSLHAENHAQLSARFYDRRPAFRFGSSRRAGLSNRAFDRRRHRRGRHQTVVFSFRRAARIRILSSN